MVNAGWFVLPSALPQPFPRVERKPQPREPGVVIQAETPLIHCRCGGSYMLYCTFALEKCCLIRYNGPQRPGNETGGCVL